MNNLKILTLNCQKGYQPSFKDFIHKILEEKMYDFILLQEANSLVVSILKAQQSSYSILNPFDEDLGENTHVCILYRNIFILKESQLISFAKFDLTMPPRGWGFLVGVFEINATQIVAGSLHLHPGLKASNRTRELEIVKEKLLSFDQEKYHIVFGGDFNSGLPREIARSERLLFPEFIRATKSIGPTLSSRYTEPAPFIANKIAVLLGTIGLGVKLKTDHVYIDSGLVKTHAYSCRALSNRISDHLAIEFLLAE